MESLPSGPDADPEHRVGPLITDRQRTSVAALVDAAAPFGGVKHSGFGVEGGAEGIAEYLETKYIAS